MTPEWTQPHDSPERLKANLLPPSVPVGRPREPLRFPTLAHTLQAPTGDGGQQEHEDRQKHPYEAPAKRGLSGRPGGGLRDTKASVTFGETSGKAEPSRAEISSVVRRNNPQPHKVSRAVTRRGVAGPCRGRAEGLAGPMGGLQGGASERGAVPAPRGAVPAPGGAVPAPVGRGAALQRVTCMRGAEDGSPWARRRRSASAGTRRVSGSSACRPEEEPQRLGGTLLLKRLLITLRRRVERNQGLAWSSLSLFRKNQA